LEFASHSPELWASRSLPGTDKTEDRLSRNLKAVELEVEPTSQLASMASQRILSQTSLGPPQPTPPTLQMDLLPGSQAAKFRGNSR
jgi:hypothetical protein